MQVAVLINPNGFSRMDVPQNLEFAAFQRHGFTGDHIFALSVFAERCAVAKRTNAVRVSESHNTVTGDHADDGIRTFHAFMYTGNCLEQGFFIQRMTLSGERQLISKHVQKHFGVAGRIDMTTVQFVKFLSQLFGVCQIAVVSQNNTEGCIDVKRLRFIRSRCISLSRITYLSNTAVTEQVSHIASSKNVTHKAHAFMHMEMTSFNRTDTGGVLTAVLQQQECIVQPLVNGTGSVQRHYSAHLYLTPRIKG